ncbi:MAG: A/G-specific adenine glycosylase [Acidobacteriota bacterium]|nr:A/G-specific adenine glycosylase [Acidobacteriota bacterium]
MLKNGEKAEFRRALLGWFEVHQRDLPWRRTSDPYAIWISEIMLQQTRVAAVIPFYERFLRRFPDYRALAEAPPSDLLAHWAGLGYYYRARNLQKAAQEMVARNGFPASYEEIRSLPGVGEYTAAAVLSIGFGLPFAAVDGNVLRVLSRILANGANIGSAAGRKHFSAEAEQLLPQEQPGAFNQAMMELGATVCLPKNPQCLVCPVCDLCQARQLGRQNEFPFKLRQNKSVEEERVVFWIERNRQILLWQRPPGTRLMPGFWELPEREHLPDLKLARKLGAFGHGITFHRYRFEIWEAEADGKAGPCEWIPISGLMALPISTIVRKALQVVERSAARSAAAD